MKIKYDPDADAMYITLREGKFHHNKEIDENMIIDYDKDNNMLGIELLFVKERNPSLLKEFKVENLASA
jgi:uncharacterized protein YuzE